MKPSEARILILLSQVDNQNRYPSYLATKLQLEYSYTTRLLRSMVLKGWLKQAISMVPVKKFYNLTKLGKQELANAMKILTGEYKEDGD